MANAVADYLIDKEYLPAMALAPSHKAKVILSHSIRNNKIDTKTIQSYCYYVPGGYDQDGNEVFKFAVNKQTGKPMMPKKMRLLIIDEISMVEQKLWDRLYPFAEKIIVLGDHNQLPAVDGNEVDMEPYKTVYLTENMRQRKEDSSMMEVINRCKDAVENNIVPDLTGIPEDETLVLTTSDLKQAYVTEPHKDKVILAASNAAVNRYNKSIKKEIGDNHYEVGDIIVLQKPLWIEYSKDSTPDFHIGTVFSIVSMVDSYEDYYDIEYIVKCERCDDTIFSGLLPKKQYIHKQNLDEMALACRKQQKRWSDFYDAKNETMDVKHTFATTAWKSQGSTFDVAMIDLPDMMKILDWKGSSEENMNNYIRGLYVAVSRAKEKLVIKI